MGLVLLTNTFECGAYFAAKIAAGRSAEEGEAPEPHTLLSG